MAPLFLTERELRGKGNAKWSLTEPGVLPCWIAEMDCAIAPSIDAAIQRVVVEQNFGYPTRKGAKADVSLAEAFADRMRSAFSWNAQAGLVLTAAELVQATHLSVLAFSEPGDGVLLHLPSYPPFHDAIRSNGRKLIPLRMHSDGDRWSFDVSSIREHLDQRARILLLCNPHNPTGRSFSRRELLEIGALAIERDLIVISDEIHSDLAYAGGRHLPFASLGPELAERTVTLNSATKSFNFPGLRCGVVHFGTADLKARFQQRVSSRGMGDGNVIGIEATVAAWTQGQSWLDGLMKHLTAARDHVSKVFATELPAIRFHLPEATYFLWLDCSELNLSGPASDFFLDQARIRFSPGQDFDPEAAHFVRFNFATSFVILDEILGRMIDGVRRAV